jgi:hypothetical protein
VAEVNRVQVDGIVARRQRVCDLQDTLMSVWTAAEMERLLAAALDSSQDVDVLLVSRPK